MKNPQISKNVLISHAFSFILNNCRLEYFVENKNVYTNFTDRLVQLFFSTNVLLTTAVYFTLNIILLEVPYTHTETILTYWYECEVA